MCGRYTLTDSGSHDLAQRFAADFDERGIQPSLLGRANIAPSQEVVAVAGDGAHGAGRRMVAAKWGLTPHWAERPMINARDDKLTGPWRGLASRAGHRALIPATGWLEWLRTEDRRRAPQPFHCVPGDGTPVAFAGLYDARSDTCLIVTTAARGECARVHDRMPAVLAGAAAEAAWLSAEVDLGDACALVTDGLIEPMRVAPVDPRLNAADVEGLELLMPPPPQPEQLTLG